MIAGIVSVAVGCVGGDVNMHVADICGRRSPLRGDRVCAERTAVFDELDRCVSRTAPAALEAAVIAQYDLLRSGGEVTRLPVGQIALEARCHLATLHSSP